MLNCGAGGGLPVARVNDSVLVSDNGITGVITTGSNTIQAC